MIGGGTSELEDVRRETCRSLWWLKRGAHRGIHKRSSLGGRFAQEASIQVSL